MEASSLTANAPAVRNRANRISEFFYRRGRLNVRRRDECITLERWLDPQPGERILDIGSGDGWWDKRIAARGASVVGIDMNDKRLAMAEVRNADPHIEYRYMDAHQMDFPDASFDKVLSMCVLEHLRDDRAVLGEAARVLKPGGQLIFSCDSMSNPEVTDADREFHRNRYAVNRYYRPDDLHQRLDEAGFSLDHVSYVLTTRMAVSIFRLSWRLELMEEESDSGLVRATGAVGGWCVNTLGLLFARAAERLRPRDDCGLTLLVRAHRV